MIDFSLPDDTRLLVDTVRRFVRDDVVRKAGEYRLSRQITAWMSPAGLEIAEQNPVRLWAVEGVRLPHRVRKKMQPKTVISQRRGPGS